MRKVIALSFALVLSSTALACSSGSSSSDTDSTEGASTGAAGTTDLTTKDVILVAPSIRDSEATDIKVKMHGLDITKKDAILKKDKLELGLSCEFSIENGGNQCFLFVPVLASEVKIEKADSGSMHVDKLTFGGESASKIFSGLIGLGSSKSAGPIQCKKAKDDKVTCTLSADKSGTREIAAVHTLAEEVEKKNLEQATAEAILASLK